MSEPIPQATPRCRPIRLDDIPALARMFEACFSGTRSAEAIAWKQFGSPWSSDAVRGVAAFVGDTPVSHFGLMPTLFHWNGEPVLAGHGCDVMTHPNFRRRGLLLQNGRFAHDHWRDAGVRLVYGLSNQLWETQLFAFGYRLIGTLLTLAFPLSAWATLRAGLAWRRRMPRPDSELIVRAVGSPALPSAFPPDEGVNSVTQDPKWLHYRYAADPAKRYQYVQLSSGDKTLATVIYRISPARFGRRATIARLLTHPPTEDDLHRILPAMVAHFGQLDAGEVRLHALRDSPLHHACLRQGWVAARGSFDVAVNVLDPELADAMHTRAWHFSGGDFDLV